MPVRRHPVALLQPNGASSIRLPPDAALIARLKETYRKARAQELRLAEIFYTKLFAAAPHLRSLFREDQRAQSAKLMAALDAVLANLENPGESGAMLSQLGRRHASYGAKPEHYTLVVELLTASMKETLGEDASELAIREWHTALTLISRQMLAGAAEEAQTPKPNQPGT